MALFKSTSPGIRLTKQLQSPSVISPSQKSVKILEAKKPSLGFTSPGKGLYNPQVNKLKLTPTNLLNTNNLTANDSVQNSQQGSYFRKPTGNAGNSRGDIKINTLIQKKQKKSDYQSLLLSTSHSNSTKNLMQRDIYSSTSQLPNLMKLYAQSPTSKNAKNSHNPEQSNNQSISFSQYGLYSPSQKPHIDQIKDNVAKATVEGKLKKILQLNSQTTIPKITLKDDLYQLKKDIEKSKDRFDDNYETSVQSSLSNSNKNFDLSRSPHAKLQKRPTKDFKECFGKLKILSPREGQKKSRPQNSEEIGQFKGLITEFQIGKCIGNGKFGKVHVARHKRSGFIVAIKSIPKAIIREYNLQNQIQTQIRHQFHCNHPSIVQLYGFFDDESSLYLIMEYMPDGTLFTLLHKKQRLEEQEVAYVLLEICNAICYLHNNKIAHRDIKPENIVLCFGFAKICDFGWSAKTMNPRKTYCGTLDYAPPQILEHKQYSETVDLWCIGILAYELLSGKVPFFCQDRSEMTKKIINIEHEKLVFREDFSEAAKDLITQLIRKNPEERMKASDILEHKFVKSYTSIN